MFKLLFFLFFVLIVYKVIQFISKALKIYSNVKNQQFAQGNRAQESQQQKKAGETTIHYKQNNQGKNASSGQNKADDEEYIDYEEVKD